MATKKIRTLPELATDRHARPWVRELAAAVLMYVDGEDQEGDELERATVAELREMLEAAGVPAPAGARKAELVELLQNARAGDAGGGET
jgi:hypothetical protein